MRAEGTTALRHEGTKGRAVAPSCPRAFVPSCLLLLLLPACSPRNFENDNDRLRAENLELQQSVQTLKGRVETLEAALEASKQTEPGARPLPQGLHAPRAVQLELHRWTTAADLDRDRTLDGVRIYAIPTDVQGRAVQVMGEAKVSLVALPEGRDPIVVQTTTLTPQQVNEAFRGGGVTGPHYTFEVPLETPLPENTPKVLVRVSLADDLTGRTLEAEQTIEWR